MNTPRSLYHLAAHAGSLRATLALMALLAAVALASPRWPWLAAAIGLLAVNLAAAVVVHPAFRRRAALLVAHLALLLLVAGVGLGRLMALDGRFELLEGEPFDGTLIDREAGVLHHDRLQRLSFTQHGFDIEYAPGRKRGATRNRVSWQGDDGTRHEAVIGDHVPLVLDGHRFYTSSNKGFAPVLRWLPDAGEPVRGAVHLPSYPAHELRQWREWTLPDGRAAWLMLHIDGEPIPVDQAARFRLPDAHRLVLRVGEARHELAPGARVRLDGGTLVYERLATWMGYRVAHDPTLPWLLAAALLAAAGFGVHYLGLFAGGAAAARPARALEWTNG